MIRVAWLVAKSHGFDSRVRTAETFCVCSRHVCVGFLLVIQIPPTVQRHAIIKDTEIPVYVCILQPACSVFSVFTENVSHHEPKIRLSGCKCR